MSPDRAFAFRAVRRDGTPEDGVVQAPTREAAIALIGSRGAFAVHVTERLGHGASGPRTSAEDLAAGLRALATLLASGTSLAKALLVLEDLVPSGWLAALPALRDRIAEGAGLAAALEASSLGLPAHIIGIIRAGEAGTGLATAVETSAELLEQRAATRAAVRNALAYPLLLAVTGSVSVTLLVTLVLPRFTDLLADAGRTLPLSTRLVLAGGSFFHAAVIPGIAALAFGAATWRAWVSHPEGVRHWHGILLSAPGIGPLRRSTAASHACAALAALLRAGVPLIAALPYAARAPGDAAVEARLLAARGRIGKGERVSTALQAEDALTPTVVRLARVGEESGQLAHMLDHAARIEAHHADQRLRRMIRVIEPSLILLFGSVVMIVAAALFQAMYGLRPS